MRFLRTRKIALILAIVSSFDMAFAAVNQNLPSTTQANLNASHGIQPNSTQTTTPESLAPSMAVRSNGSVQSTRSAQSANGGQVKTQNSDSGELNPNMVVLNFENSDIQSTIKAISQLSGKNFVIDPRVKGTVTIVSDKPIAKVDSYKVLETALRMQGFAVVEGDGVIKVLPEADAKTYGMKTFSQGKKFGNQIGDQIVTKIFIIQHGSATQLANSLRPLIAPNNSISVYPNSNALIVTDYASNISRVTKIINQLTSTVDSRSQPEIVQMKYSVAADIAQLLQSYVQNGNPNGGGGGSANSDAPAVTITVDPASNSLIIYSVVQDRMNEIRDLAVKLDKNQSTSNSNLHVVYLRNADAAHIADVLRVVASGQENPNLTATSASANFTTEPTTMFSSGTSGGAGGSTGGASFGGAGAASRGQQSSNNPGSNTRAGANGQANAKDQPKIFIQAEPTTNSLIIEAPEAVYRNLRMIIEMLDVRRAQIMIEAMIVNLDSNMVGTFGIQWAVGAGGNSLAGVGIGNYGGNGTSISSIATAAAGLAAGAAGTTGAAAAAAPPVIPNQMLIGLVTGTVSVGGKTIPSLGALANMLDGNSSVNILSRPTLITLDNEEARIMVGQNVPVPNGNYQSTVAGSGIVNTISRQQIGTFLDIKPLITQSGAIQLEIYQETSNINTTLSSVSANGPSFDTQNMRTTLLVDDGQIIAIGGMTQDQVSITKNGIPLLDDIPYLGWLFSWQERQHLKKNLVLFLRPVIVRNEDGYKALTNSRYKYIMDQQNMVQAKGNWMLPTINPINVDNQVPYANQKIPSQPDNTEVQTPLVDMRASKVNVNNKFTPQIISRDSIDNNTGTVIAPAN